MTRCWRQRLPIHYGWVVVFAGMLTVLACLGFGRFALGMLLPSMGSSLQLSYAEMGFISTGNFVGYLAAVLLGGYVSGKLGARRTIVIGLVIVAVSMVLVGRAAGFAEVLALYVATGAGSGAANVPIMGLVSHWFTRRLRGRAAGFVVVGSGMAIVLCGQLIPEINARYGAEGWRISWAVLGSLSLAAAVLTGVLLRDDPSELGLAPAGPAAAPAHSQQNSVAGRDVVAHLGVIYLLFGSTYVVYATFIVTTLVQERGFAETVAGQFWSAVGLLSLISGPLFGSLSDRLGRKTGLSIVFAIQALAYLCVALPLPQAFVYASIALFGIVAWSVPPIIAAAVGDYMGPRLAAASFGTVTFFFGIGQIVGPTVAGIMAERSGSFTSSYLMSAALVSVAIVLTGALRRPPAQDL